MFNGIVVNDLTGGRIYGSMIGALPDAPLVDDGLVEGHTYLRESSERLRLLRC